MFHIPGMVVEWITGVVAWGYTLSIWRLTVKFERESSFVLGDARDESVITNANAEEAFE